MSAVANFGVKNDVGGRAVGQMHNVESRPFPIEAVLRCHQTGQSVEMSPVPHLVVFVHRVANYGRIGKGSSLPRTLPDEDGLQLVPPNGLNDTCKVIGRRNLCIVEKQVEVTIKSRRNHLFSSLCYCLILQRNFAPDEFSVTIQWYNVTCDWCLSINRENFFRIFQLICASRY